jgi:hypothetical protein
MLQPVKTFFKVDKAQLVHRWENLKMIVVLVHKPVH